ncbi:MAG: hypothetical protein ACRELY_07895 [Polyangiaceae bacterium]
MLRSLARCSSPCLALAALALTTPARAQEPTPAPAPPSADLIRSAAAEYDAGRRAFLAKSYEEAAIHFENAFHDAPRAEALRNAIRARNDAKQPARAATLAALGEQLYPDDTNTMVVVHDTLSGNEKKLQRISLICTPKCGVTADARLVSLDDSTHIVFFLDPGPHDVVASWQGNSKEMKITAKAGDRLEWNFTEPTDQSPPTAQPQVVTPPPQQPPPKEQPVQAASSKPFGPVVFFIGAGLTAVAGAATIISGIDTENSPGQDAVRTQCAGQGDDCQLYQDGRSKQLRTNILLGTTIGLGVVTGVIGVFFTQWSHPKSTTTGLVEPYFDGDAHSGTAGLRGSF